MELFVFTYNEEKILPFLIEWYKKRFKNLQITLIDNESTDNTVKIALENGCKIITSKTNGYSDNTIRQNLRNNIWKNSKHQWVGVIDADEMVDIYEKDLKDFTIISTKGYSIINKDNVDYKDMIWGFYDPGYSKNVIFDRTKVKEINFTPGGHKIKPVGILKYSNKTYNLYHYHYISEDSLIAKYKERQKRRSKEDARKNHSVHYFKTDKQISDIYTYNIKRSAVVKEKEV